MAYRINDKENNIFKRNTSYQNFGGILCCTCGLCVKRENLPKITFKNFRPREDSYFPDLYGNYISFTQDVMPNGEFTYTLDFDSFMNENPESSDLSQFKYANSLTYYPFRNCSGVPSSYIGFGTFPPYPQNWFSQFWWSPNWFPVLNGTGKPYNSDINYLPPNPSYSNGFYNPALYYNPDFWYQVFEQNKLTNASYWSTCNTYVDYDHFISECPEAQIGLQPCTKEQLELYFPFDYKPAPQPPENPYPIGNYAPLFDYISSHDFSLQQINESNSCENNVVAVAPPLPLVDYSNFNFPDVYPVSIPSSKYTTFNPNKPFDYGNGFQEYPQPIDTSTIAKGGYVLSNCNLSIGRFPKKDYFGDIFEASFSMIPKYFHKFYLYNCADAEFKIENPIFNNQIQCFSYGVPPYPTCLYLSNSVFMSVPGSDSPNFDYKAYYNSHINKLFETVYYPTWLRKVWIKYLNGEQVSQGIWASFAGVNEFPGYLGYFESYLREKYFWYLNDSSIVSVSNSGTRTSITDSSGKTTFKIQDLLFIGPTYMRQGFLHKDPELLYNIGTYTKYLSVGFKCDVEIEYYSKPMCYQQQIPERLARVEEYKVKLENYRPYKQPNNSVRDTVQYFFSENPDDKFSYSVFNSYMWYRSSTIYAPSSANIFDTYYEIFYTNFIYAPPDMNQNAEFIIDKNGIKKNIQDIEQFVYKVYTSSLTTKNWPDSFFKNIGNFYGRLYTDKYDEDYKNSIFVSGIEEMWETGNEITISTQSLNYVPLSLRPIQFGSTPRKYYCIFVKKISDNSFQNAGSIQIRLANSYDDAINEIPIEIKEYTDKNVIDDFNSKINLNVKYKYYKKNVSKYDAPYYSDFKTSDYVIDNPNLDNIGINYTINPDLNSNPYNIGEVFLEAKLINGYPYSFKFYSENVKNFYFIGTINGRLPYPSSNPDMNNYIYFDDRPYYEVESLHPLKFKIKNVLFFSYYLGPGYFNYEFNYESLYGTTINNMYASGYFGFECDISFEENIDEFHENSLPEEFNKILDMDLFIQTSGVYNSKSPLKMINPEKCTHIGKVIDRKDCNCPKKWIRQCEIHETTDWKKCMSCPNYQPED